MNKLLTPSFISLLYLPLHISKVHPLIVSNSPKVLVVEGPIERTRRASLLLLLVEQGVGGRVLGLAHGLQLPHQVLQLLLALHRVAPERDVVSWNFGNN